MTLRLESWGRTIEYDGRHVTVSSRDGLIVRIELAVLADIVITSGWMRSSMVPVPFSDVTPGKKPDGKHPWAVTFTSANEMHYTAFRDRVLNDARRVQASPLADRMRSMGSLRVGPDTPGLTVFEGLTAVEVRRLPESDLTTMTHGTMAHALTFAARYRSWGVSFAHLTQGLLGADISSFASTQGQGAGMIQGASTMSTTGTGVVSHRLTGEGFAAVLQRDADGNVPVVLRLVVPSQATCDAMVAGGGRHGGGRGRTAPGTRARGPSAHGRCPAHGDGSRG